MIQVKHIKKVTSFLLILVTAFLLVACSKKENVPYGDIKGDDYLTVGDVKITDRDVYDTLRRQGASVLPKMVEEKLFEGYLNNAKELLKATNVVEGSKEEWAQKEFDNIVKKAIFQTDDVESIEKMPELNRKTLINKYVDSLYKTDFNIDRTTLVQEIQAFVADTLADEDYAKGFYTNDTLLKLYVIEIQKLIYAKEQLDKNVIDEESDDFVKDTSVISHFKNNVKKQFDTNVFYFHFISTNEANAAFTLLNLKNNSRGHWFEIPDIRLVAIYDEFKDNEEHQIWEVLEKTKLTTKFEQTSDLDATKTKINEEDYKKFYDAYGPSETNSQKLPVVSVLQKFIELHNIVNTKKLVQVADDVDLINLELKYTNGVVYETEKSYDDLTKLNTTFRNYIYDTLTEEKPYSTLRTVGEHRYLAFKLDKNYYELNYVSEEKDEDDNEKWVTIDELKELLEKQKEDLEDNTKEPKLLNDLRTIEGVVNSAGEVNWDVLDTKMKENIKSWTEEVISKKLTTSYASTKVSNLLKDAKVEIYDNVIRSFYNQSTDNKAKGKAKNGNDLLKLTVKLNDENVTVEITVNDLYKKLEQNDGLEVAIDLALNEILLDEYNKKNGLFKDDEISLKDFKKEYKELINNFSNDQFAQAGYPASIGRETFLLLLFGTKNVDEAIEQGYLLPKLRELFSEKTEVTLPGVDVNSQLAKFAALQHEKFIGFQVSHLLVYFDPSGTGSPVDPKEYFEDLEQVEIDEIKQAIVDMYALVIDELGNPGLTTSKLKAIAQEFQESARIDLGNNAKTTWQTFRKYGLNLKFEDLGSELTNTSNLPTNSSTLDKVFYNRAIELFNIIKADKDSDDEDLVDGGLPFLDFGGSLNIIHQDDQNVADYLNEDGIMSSFGFHFIMVTSVSEKLSAVYKESDDYNEDYTFEIDGTKYNPYNEDSETITKSQVDYYLKGKKLDDPATLPSKVLQAFTKYFDPIYKLYQGNSMNQAIMYNYISNQGLNLHGKEARFKSLQEINQTEFHNYLLGNDSNYDELYATWFESFKLDIK
ncbi:hypothetical protein [Haploplasma modicum]|uniref:hypothetical protein n=1 Tax=Haploplasma modicum TaxID=2150 RepID=UPI00047D4895|nr:hypothetical protein [Haploplasma modicum]